LFTYGLKKIRKLRRNYGKILGNNLLNEFNKFLEENKKEAKKVAKITIKSIEIVY